MQRLCAGLALCLAMFSQAAPAERCRAIAVVADEKLEGHTLSLTLVHEGRDLTPEGAGASQLRVGAAVDVCFQSSRDGYVSLWSHDADNNAPVRILPNEYIDAVDDELGIAVQAGVPKCFSELAAGAGRKISLKVQPPLGGAELYLHYAQGRDGQIAPDDFPSIGNKSVNLQPSCERHGARNVPRTQTAPYASKTLQYEVVQ